MIAVGNDVVDLCDPDAIGKSRDERFVERILTPDEAAIFGPQLTDALLWRLWSAKESAYKIVSKVFGTFPAARALEVRPDASPDEGMGVVDTEHGPIQVRWTDNPRFVHCVAWWSKTALSDPESRIAVGVKAVSESELLSPRERLSAKNPSSAAVRSLAKALLGGDSEAVDPVEIIRHRTDRGFGPPRFECRGEAVEGHDLSLSHHGGFVAAVVSHPEVYSPHE